MAISYRLTTRQKWEGLFWLLLAVGLMITWAAIVLNLPRVAEKGHFIPHGDESTAIACIILTLLAAGAALGAGIGTLTKVQFQCAMIGIFAWPTFLLVAATIYRAIF